MKLIILSFFTTFAVLPNLAFSESCNHMDEKTFALNNTEVTAKIWVSGGDCKRSNFKLGIHAAKSKPLYISESIIGNYLGKQAADLTPDKTKQLVSQFLNDFVQPIPVKSLTTDNKCLNWVPDEYIEKLVQDDGVMYSHNVRTQETRFISYVTEIDQMVVIAQCGNRKPSQVHN